VFLPGVSEAIDAGVPETGGASLLGALSSVERLAVGSGRVWITDRLEHEPFATRIDAFDQSTGVWLAPQLAEEGGVFEPSAGLAVGHLGVGLEQVYAGGLREGQSVLAVYDVGEGKLAGVWSGAATAGGSFSGLSGVAVDGSGSIETAGDVYVAASSVVDVFAPEAGGDEPASTVAEITGTCAVAGSSCPGEEIPFGRPSGVAVSGQDGTVLVTDEKRVVDVFRPTTLGQYEYVRQLAGTPTGAGGSEALLGAVVSVAVDDSNGDIYIVDREAGAVDQFSASGEYLGRITGTPAGSFHTLHTVAVNPADGHVFVGSYDEESRVGTVDVFDKGIVLPDVASEPASGMVVSAGGVISAVLHGSVNPVGAGAILSCGFAWGTSEAFGQTAPCFPEGIANGSSPIAVEATLGGLAPDTSYSFRVGATNANGANPGEPFQTQTFLTPGPGLHSAFASEVSSTSATLGGAINPHGHPTSFYFQYGKSTSYEAQVPAEPVTIGEGEEDVALPGQHLQSLASSTVYHYRLVAVSELEAEGSVNPITFTGPDNTFTTQAAGDGFALPDNRRWQLATPPDKHGAFIRPIAETGLTQASSIGDAFSYVVNIPTEAGVKGNDETIQLYSTRTPTGWSTQDLTTPHSTPVLEAGFGGEYRAFSADLSNALVEAPGAFSSLAPEAFPPDSEHTPYLRHNTTCAMTPSTCYQPLLTTTPGYANVPAGTHLEAESGAAFGVARFRGASSDMQHVVIASGVALNSTPISGGELYEWSAGAPVGVPPVLVSVLPNGKPTSLRAELGGFGGQIVRGAVSGDGSRVVWSELGGHLYVRDVARGETVQLDAVAPEASGANGVNPAFQLASVDGSRVLFTDTQRLTTDSRAGTHQPDLYACEITVTEAHLACVLSDLTAGAEAGDVKGVALGASDDASTVYFAANAQLASGAVHGSCEGEVSPVGAECNLYVVQRTGAGWGEPQLVAVVSGDDFPDWVGNGGGSLTGLTSRVSADGGWLVFMSDRELTGYESRDAVSGHPDEEVYLYHAGADVGVVCVSCDSSGARPVGVEYATINGELVGGDRVWPHEQWVAANIPGWTPFELTHAAYASRVLSSSGRVFFNALGGLVARDINHGEDVYEFEPSGVGDCSPGSGSGGVVYLAGSGGCVGLVSSGRSTGESAFMDASESGDDVFFLTSERLVSKDVDTAIDVYDAHACTGISPCLSEETAPPACVTTDSCRGAGQSTQPSVFGVPASAEFHGSGNPPLPAPPPGLTNRQKLAKTLVVCRKRFRHARRRRVVCERQARRRYPVGHVHKPAKGKHK
jgi:hypothetical protein